MASVSETLDLAPHPLHLGVGDCGTQPQGPSDLLTQVLVRVTLLLGNHGHCPALTDPSDHAWLRIQVRTVVYSRDPCAAHNTRIL